ncbi:MAG: Rpn family recombination-promoting nuclease/putative transposase [Fibrobacter sp.]|nr:Rpn family recombination-promoting nuclease/putative transposase [Fibrobacter sp.]
MNKKKHDSLFRWLFADTRRTRLLLKLAAKHNEELQKFLESIDLKTLERIPDSYSEVADTGEADLAFRVNVVTGVPVLVGILLEHKSGRDRNTFNQIARYVHSVMKNIDRTRMFEGLPTMAIIFYNGRENWDPLAQLEKDYPEFWHGRILPCPCTFVNMADITDEDCLACEDVATGMGIAAMKLAFDERRLAEILPKFKTGLRSMDAEDNTCLLEKIRLYLQEYFGESLLKEFDMAFVSIGQKYGFVSIGDSIRRQVAEARAEGESVGEARGEQKGRVQNQADTLTVLREMGLSEEKIAEAKARLEALQQSRSSK